MFDDNRYDNTNQNGSRGYGGQTPNRNYSGKTDEIITTSYNSKKSDSYNANNSGVASSVNSFDNIKSAGNVAGSYNNRNGISPNASQSSSYNAGYSQGQSVGKVNSYEWGTQGQANPAPRKKKEKKPVTRSTVAIVLAAAVIISALFGVGSGVGTYFLMSGNTSHQENGLSIYKNENTGGAEETEGVLSTKEITNKVADSVVEIVTETVSYSMFYGQAVTEGAGSGVIIDKDGYIVTNNHVIENAKKITVKLRNGNEYTAKLVGTDADKDVALIKIEPKKDDDLTIAVFGDSDKLAVGDKAVVIGNPLGQLGGTVTDGIISALDRQLDFDGTTMNLLQTDTAINPGNSGGGLFDGQGNLVGIVVAKATGNMTTSVEGLGFAIPINDAQKVIGDLKNYGYVKGKPAEIGVTLQDYMDMVYIYSVAENSAAEKGGLQKGDKIMSIDGEDIKSSSDVKSKISSSKAGDKLKFTIERNGSKKELTIVVEEASQEQQQPTTVSQDTYNIDDDLGSIWDDFDF